MNFIFNVIAGSSSLEEFQGAALLIAKSVLPKNVRSPQGQQLDWLSCVVRNPLGIDMYSANHGLLIRLNCLHQAGCDITPVIHFAIQNKNSKFLNVVRQMDVNLETTDVEFNNVLHLVFNDYLTHQNIAQLVEQVFSYSLKNVLLLTQQNHSNQTPLDLALKPLSPEESTVFKQEFEKQLVQKAASLDKLDASRNIAHCILGTLYQTDFFTKADLVKAFHHFNLANQSNRCPQASYLLGLAYLKMEGVEQQNVALGVSLIESAANAGMAHAQLALAHIKLKGVLSPQNISQAMHWLHLAAKQGNAQARFDLACLAEKNYHANPHKPMPPALHYELAAQLGHLDAQFKIGLTHIYNFKALIAEGKSGAEPSLVRHLQQGCMWLKLAWKNGHFYAGNEWAWSKSDLEKFAPEHALANENPLYMHSPYTETIAPHLETPKPYLDQRIKTLKSGVNIVLGQLKGRYPNSLLSDYQFFETAATALGPLNQKLNRYDQCSVALRPTPKFKSIYTQNTLQQVGLFRSVGVDESKITDFEYNLSMAKEVLKLGALLRVQFQSGNAPDFDSLWCYCRAWRVSRLASFSEQEEVKSFKASRLTHSNRIRTPLHLGSERYAAILNELITDVTHKRFC